MATLYETQQKIGTLHRSIAGRVLLLLLTYTCKVRQLESSLTLSSQISRLEIAYSNDDNSATMSKLTAQGSHDRQTTDLPVLAALVLSGL